MPCLSCRQSHVDHSHSQSPDARWLPRSFLLLSLTYCSRAFQSHPVLPGRCSSRRNRLFGLPEWRDKFNSEDLSPTPTLLLPFPAEEALIQGQSKKITLKEGRFFDLFQDCIDEHASIVGMALMGDDGILKEMPLCEIHDFEVNSGFRGRVSLDVTLRAVGRAKIMELTQMKPIVTAMSTELVDEDIHRSSLLMANELVVDIERMIQGLSGGVSRYQRYNEAYELALDTADQGLLTSNDSPGPDDQRSVCELTAASWAVFATVSDKSTLHKAIATAGLIERLQLGLKAILDERFHMSTAPFRTDGAPGFQ